MVKCECGCGNVVNPGRRFYKWHGCYGIKPEHIEKQRQSLLGHKYNGKNCPKCGKTHPDKTGKNNSIYNILKGKTLEEYYGKEVANEIKIKRKMARPLKTHCIRGHEFTADNTVIGSKSERNCKICRKLLAHEWYSKHPKIKKRHPTKMERFWNMVDKTSFCWNWIGAKVNDYGKFEKTTAHRFSYELHNGAIADDFEIHHLCKNRGCVNPDHLKLVSHKENMKLKSPYKASDTTRMKASLTHKRKWADYDYKAKKVSELIKARYPYPNKDEQRLEQLLQTILPNEYKFNNGWFILGGKVPDFPNVNGKKKLILHHGVRWHLSKFYKEIPNLTKEQVEKQDIEYFKKFGYGTLIIWDNEWSDQNKIVDKILAFQKE